MFQYRTAIDEIQDAKDVMILSNCYKPNLTITTKKNRSDELETMESSEVVGLCQHDQKLTNVGRNCFTLDDTHDLWKEKEKVSFLTPLQISQKN